MIAILSDSGQFRADLAETADGFSVAFSRKITFADGEIWKRMHCETIDDVVFHVACDLVHDLVNTLQREPAVTMTPTQKRLRVLSIIR